MNIGLLPARSTGDSSAQGDSKPTWNCSRSARKADDLNGEQIAVPLQVTCIKCLLDEYDLWDPDKLAKVCRSNILAGFNGGLLLALQKDCRKCETLTIAKPNNQMSCSGRFLGDSTFRTANMASVPLVVAAHSCVVL